MTLRSREQLTTLIAARGHTTVTLAHATGLTKQLIAYLVGTGRTARSTCSRRTANLLANALDVPVATLFYDRLSEKSNNNPQEGETQQ